MLQINQETKLSDWNSQLISELLDADEGEGLFYDFKASLHDTELIRKAATSFANYLGGFLVFGIKDKKAASGWARLNGIDDNEFAKELTNKLSGGKIVPNLIINDPKKIEITYKTKAYKVMVVHVEESSLRPHAIISNKDGLLEFWTRGNSTAVAVSYPQLTKSIEEARDTRNWLAALYLDTEYVDNFAQKMVIEDKDRSAVIPVHRINALVNSEASSSAISRIPTDIELIKLIWQLRELIDLVNSYRDMMIARRPLPLSNAATENQNDNKAIASAVPQIKQLTLTIRQHLANRYAGVREWINVVQKTGKTS